MINIISQLNNLNIYKPQNGQKIPKLSFKADSVEISDKEKKRKEKKRKEKKNKKTIAVLSLLLCLVSGMYFGSFFESIVKKTKCGGCR